MATRSTTKAPTAKASAAGSTPAELRSFETIDVALRNDVALVTLNRPDVHNAFDEKLIEELTRALASLSQREELRALILLAAGESFCAGADLAWMQRMAGYDEARNVADAGALAELLRSLAHFPRPTIARIHGQAFGGGVGLIACCDIAIASTNCAFALSEVKLGVIPATIGPYVIEALGARAARRYMLTGERFDAAEAYRIGLVHDLVPTIDALDARINEVLGAVMLAGPKAQAAVKELVRAVAHRPIDAQVIADTASRIAKVRAGAEAKEGMGAFLERRSPAFVPEALRKKKRR